MKTLHRVLILIVVLTAAGTTAAAQDGATHYVRFEHNGAAAVELDGAVHETSWQRASDEARTDFLTSQGIRVIRFENRKVFTQLDVVLEAIAWHFGGNEDFL